MHPKGTRQRVFVRQAPALTSLAAYTGNFASAELDVHYLFAIRDGTLHLSHRKLGDLALEPAGRDVFTTPNGGTLVFQRDRRGRVTGFTLNDARVRGVRFVRTP
jgi:hypothetical protein